MLVLMRKEGEEIIVGNGEIRITILDTRRGCVRIGITAPESVPIMRAELLPKLNAAAPVETVQNLITPLIAGA